MYVYQLANMKLKFRTIANKMITFEVNGENTIQEVKNILGEKEEIDPATINLIYGGKILVNDKTVDDYELNDSKAIIIHIQKQKKTTNTPQNHSQPKPAPAAPKKSKDTPKQEQDPNQTTPKPTAVHDSPQVPAPAPQTPVEPTTRDGPSANPLPMAEDKGKLVDPPNFETMVNDLVALGFVEGDAQMALRAAVYNPNRAAEFLMNGYIPELPDLYEPDEEGDFEEDFFDADPEEEDDLTDYRREIYMALKSDPSLLPVYLQDMAAQNPAVAPLIKSDPAAFLASIGLNPQDFDLSGLSVKSEYETYLDKFGEEEKEAIHRLEKMGFDAMTVIQVYEACGRNETTAAMCLSSMK